MALVEITNPDSDEGEWTFWKKDPQDPEKKIRFRIRRIPPHVNKRFRRHGAGAVSVGKIERESVSDRLDRGEEITAQRAAFALLDSENFEIIAKDSETAKAYTDFLKPEKPYAAGDAISFDGKWPKPPTVERPWESDPLRSHILKAWPRLAVWVAEKSDEQSKQEADEEAELGKT